MDYRTDIWSLGIVLFEMVTGIVPFRGRSSSDVLVAILDREPPPLARFDPEAPSELQRITSKALRKSVDERYQTAKDLLLDLQTLRDEVKGLTPAPADLLLDTPSSASLLSSPSSSQPSPFAPARMLVADPRYNLWQGRLSPDGRWLAFVFVSASGQGYPAIAIVDTSRTSDTNTFNQRHRVGAELLFVDKPRWSPDGRLLYFIARGAASRFNVWAARINPTTGMPSGAPFQVTHFDRPDLFISPDVDQAEMSLSADRLVLTMKQMTGSIWILDVLSNDSETGR